MQKYRVEFKNLEIQSILPTEQDVPESDTILEEKTGETVYAIMHAENENEAREKAERLADNLRNHNKVR
jgi:hypothetical protein